jgi:ABC-type dipeptide/oligopeptide/nickel transport system permease subunit
MAFVGVSMLSIGEEPVLIVFSVIFDWTFIYHQMRSQFLQLRNREYAEAASALGSNHWRTITKHILPNALTPLVIFSPFAIAANISGLALLRFAYNQPWFAEFG